MNMPGFTAESALPRTPDRYRGARTLGGPADVLRPAITFPFGSPPSVSASLQLNPGFENLGTLTVTGTGFSPNTCVQVDLFDYQFAEGATTSPTLSRCFGSPIPRCFLVFGGSFRVDFPNLQANCNDTTRVTVNDPSGPGVFLQPVTVRCGAPSGSPSPPCSGLG
jgi:hypothetical protein